MIKQNEIETKSNDISDILELLRSNGVVVLLNHYPEKTISKLREEFDLMTKTERDWVVPLDYSIGKGTRVIRDNHDENLFPITEECFSSKFMTKIAEEYLDGEFDINREIYVMNDVPGAKHIAQNLHYDRIHTLKFFIYLTKTTAENGAFYCVPGSQKFTQKNEKKNRQNGFYAALEESRNLPLDLVDKQIPVEGPGGTLIIFDTDVFHRAGIVKSGERFVMRGHTRTHQVKKMNYLPDNLKEKNKLESLPRKIKRFFSKK